MIQPQTLPEQEEAEKPKINSEFKPKYDFIETREMTVADFYRTLFVQFAKYRADQRIPRLDGLAETQRKIIWTAINKNYTKKTKLIQVMSDVTAVAKYHHGPASLEETLNNLIAPYKNNLCILRPDGSFGARTVRYAAASRYTETRNIPYLKKLFPLEDIAATNSYRSVDGDPAEPLTLYPILPMGIINGQSQAAVGFSTNLLPRDTLTIVDLLMNLLTGKVNSIPAHIPPCWPSFFGDIELVGKNKWEIRGKVRKITKGKRKAIEIYEVPYNWSRETLIRKLTDFKDEGLIESWSEACKGDVFSAEVVATKLFDLSEETIVEKLGLIRNETERFVYIASEEDILDENGKVIKTSRDKFELKCENIAVYINYFIKKRIAVYEKRKQYRLAKKLWELQKLIAMINYINEVNAGRIEIRNKSEAEIVEQLVKYPKEYQFAPIHERFVFGNEMLISKPNWNYLFDFKTRNFTPEAIVRLNKNYQELYNEFLETQKITAAALWYQDLVEFRDEYIKYNTEKKNIKKV